MTQHEVIVVGGGMGGLITAALLAARGVDVCLFERQSQVGGCAANFEHLGYSFEPGFGLYSGWDDDGVWDRIFRELGVAAPAANKLSPSYIVRLPDGSEVAITADREAFESNIAAAFPDCGNDAVRFFRTIRKTENQGTHDDRLPQTLLADTSKAFRLFVDAQLQTFAQCASADCPFDRASAALKIATGNLWSIDGGQQALIGRLADSLKRSGGSLRLNSPVLRLAYGSDGHPMGVDLLSGERLIASRAIVSNLTIWDTYGKLIGPSRTPQTTLASLKKISAWGAYLIFMSVDERFANDHLPSRLMLLYNSAGDEPYDPTNQQLMLNLALRDSACAPAGQRAVTAAAFTHAQDWFAFHQDTAVHDERDQAELEKWWTRLHSAMPELGDQVEVIETLTPPAFYETTRRKFGMIGAPSPPWKASEHALPFANLFLVSDTSAKGVGLEGVALEALSVADSIVKPR